MPPTTPTRARLEGINATPLIDGDVSHYLFLIVGSSPPTAASR
jgi:hypothetical protein